MKDVLKQLVTGLENFSKNNLMGMQHLNTVADILESMGNKTTPLQPLINGLSSNQKILLESTRNLSNSFKDISKVNKVDVRDETELKNKQKELLSMLTTGLSSSIAVGTANPNMKLPALNELMNQLVASPVKINGADATMDGKPVNNMFAFLMPAAMSDPTIP